MKKISIAELKRCIDGRMVKLVAQGVGNHISFDKIDKILSVTRDAKYGVVSFSTAYMIRTFEDGSSSRCRLQGLTAFMGENGVVMVAPWGEQVNVMTYQF